jgi:hypothetical protein
MAGKAFSAGARRFFFAKEVCKKSDSYLMIRKAKELKASYRRNYEG